MALPLGRVIIAAVAVMTVGAQTQPDFSGRWVLTGSAAPGADVPKALSVRQTRVTTNVRGEPIGPFFKQILIERELETGTSSETHAIGIVGGTVPGRRPDGTPNGPTTHHQVKWDIDTLVFETGTYHGDRDKPSPWMERREAWSLDPDGRLRIVITTRSSDEPLRTVTLLYRRT